MQRIRGDTNQERIRDTNQDAILCKLSAISIGYLKDEFTALLAKPKGPIQRKQPVINRGSWCRTTGIDRLVHEFISTNNQKCQIISLGAGSDSRWFLLKESKRNPLLYIEVDFGQITGKKAMTICKNRKLKEMLGPNVKIEKGGQDLVSDEYWLVSGDLRDFSSAIMPRLNDLGLDQTLPTMFISECVLIYIDPEIGNNLLTFVNSSFSNSCIVTYEQILPHDPFGKTMIHNLKLRGLSLESIDAYPTLEAQQARYRACGWPNTFAMDVNTFWKNHVHQEEKDWISKLEMWDEEEEWNLITAHYCFVFASSSSSVLPTTMFSK